MGLVATLATLGYTDLEELGRGSYGQVRSAPISGVLLITPGFKGNYYRGISCCHQVLHQ